MISSNSCCDNLTNAAKGTGYFFAATVCAAGTVLVTAIVAGTILGVMFSPVALCVHMALKSTLTLLWTIPVALFCMAVITVQVCCCSGICCITLTPIGVMSGLTGIAKDYMLEEFSAIRC